MTAKPFLMNQWYVAARKSEVSRSPLGRTICGVPMVFYRRGDGSAAALDDRCPHRKYPLSKGRLIGDDIECAYHGLRFGGGGACTLIPAQTDIPRGFGTRAFPAAEKSALVYVWPGDPALADAALIPDFPENDSAEWKPMSDYLHIEANWQLIVDNLLDLTHLTFVHKTSLASPGIQENPLTVTVDGDIVRAKREMRGVPAAPIFRLLRDFDGNTDRSQNITFTMPNHIHIRSEAAAAGVEGDPDRVRLAILNHLTPETERTTHYFWSIAHRAGAGGPGISERVHSMNKMAFDEDVGILREQQKMLDTDSTPMVNLAADKALNEARRIIRRKFAEEAAAG